VCAHPGMRLGADLCPRVGGRAHRVHLTSRAADAALHPTKGNTLRTISKRHGPLLPSLLHWQDTAKAGSAAGHTA
jgi:hypothetical protein